MALNIGKKVLGSTIRFLFSRNALSQVRSKFRNNENVTVHEEICLNISCSDTYQLQCCKILQSNPVTQFQIIMAESYYRICVDEQLVEAARKTLDLLGLTIFETIYSHGNLILITDNNFSSKMAQMFDSQISINGHNYQVIQLENPKYALLQFPNQSFTSREFSGAKNTFLESLKNFRLVPVKSQTFVYEHFNLICTKYFDFLVDLKDDTINQINSGNICKIIFDVNFIIENIGDNIDLQKLRKNLGDYNQKNRDENILFLHSFTKFRSTLCVYRAKPEQLLSIKMCSSFIATNRTPPPIAGRAFVLLEKHNNSEPIYPNQIANILRDANYFRVGDSRLDNKFFSFAIGKYLLHLKISSLNNDKRTLSTSFSVKEFHSEQLTKVNSLFIDYITETINELRLEDNLLLFSNCYYFLVNSAESQTKFERFSQIVKNYAFSSINFKFQNPASVEYVKLYVEPYILSTFKQSLTIEGKKLLFDYSENEGSLSIIGGSPLLDSDKNLIEIVDICNLVQSIDVASLMKWRKFSIYDENFEIFREKTSIYGLPDELSLVNRFESNMVIIRRCSSEWTNILTLHYGLPIENVKKMKWNSDFRIIIPCDQSNRERISSNLDLILKNLSNLRDRKKYSVVSLEYVIKSNATLEELQEEMLDYLQLFSEREVSVCLGCKNCNNMSDDTDTLSDSEVMQIQVYFPSPELFGYQKSKGENHCIILEENLELPDTLPDALPENHSLLEHISSEFNSLMSKNTVFEGTLKSIEPEIFDYRNTTQLLFKREEGRTTTCSITTLKSPTISNRYSLVDFSKQGNKIIILGSNYLHTLMESFKLHIDLNMRIKFSSNNTSSNYAIQLPELIEEILGKPSEAIIDIFTRYFFTLQRLEEILNKKTSKNMKNSTDILERIASGIISRNNESMPKLKHFIIENLPKFYYTVVSRNELQETNNYSIISQRIENDEAGQIFIYIIAVRKLYPQVNLLRKVINEEETILDLIPATCLILNNISAENDSLDNLFPTAIKYSPRRENNNYIIDFDSPLDASFCYFMFTYFARTVEASEIIRTEWHSNYEIENVSNPVFENIINTFIEPQIRREDWKKYYDNSTKKSVGGGSYGSVYKVKRIEGGGNYAIKILRDVRLGRSEFIDFLPLKHPNTIKFWEAFETEDEFVIVMELVDNPISIHELRKYTHLPSPTKGNGLNEDYIREILLQVLQGLEYLHSGEEKSIEYLDCGSKVKTSIRRVLHRDLKSDNILISFKNESHRPEDIVVKIIDFGISTLSIATHTTCYKGTPHYSAPEVLKQSMYSPASDIWSIGIYLHELIDGIPPFYHCQTFPSIMREIDRLTDDDDILPRGNDYISDNLSCLVSTFLKISPAGRPDISDILESAFFEVNS